MHPQNHPPDAYTLWTLRDVSTQRSHCAVQLEGLEQKLAEATAKAALFEGRFQEERALRRQVSPTLSCNNGKIMESLTGPLLHENGQP